MFSHIARKDVVETMKAALFRLCLFLGHSLPPPLKEKLLLIFYFSYLGFNHIYSAYRTTS